MSVLIKSNVGFSGSSAHSARQLSQTPQEAFDEYVSRVTLDGGEIIDPARTLADIEFVYSQGLLGKLGCMVSASYGVKRSANDVSVAYSIDGVDLFNVTTGVCQPVQIDTSGLPVFIAQRVTSTRFSFLRSVEKIKPALMGRLGMAVISEPGATVESFFGITGGLNSGQNSSLMQLRRSSTGVTAYALTVAGNQTITEGRFGADPDGGSGYCAFIDTNQDVFRAARDGTEVSVTWSTTSLSDIYNTSSQYLCMLGVENSSGVSVNQGARGHLLWCFRDLNREQSAQISGYLDDIY